MLNPARKHLCHSRVSFAAIGCSLDDATIYDIFSRAKFKMVDVKEVEVTHRELWGSNACLLSNAADT